jgi:hypothetical protein
MARSGIIICVLHSSVLAPKLRLYSRESTLVRTTRTTGDFQLLRIVLIAARSEFPSRSNGMKNAERSFHERELAHDGVIVDGTSAKLTREMEAGCLY